MESDYAAQAVGPNPYEVTYEQLLLEARQRCDCQIVLVEPYPWAHAWIAQRRLEAVGL